MSRPGYRKDDAQRRDQLIKFRCTSAEAQAIAERADALGVSRSEYGRALLIDGAAPRRPPTKINARAAGALNRLAVEIKRNGVNANQLARQANAHFIDDHFEDRLLAYMARMDTLLAESRAVIDVLLEAEEAPDA